MICKCPESLATLESKKQLGEKVKPIVWGKFGRKHFLIFLDTGATVSLIGEDLYNKHFRDLPLWGTDEGICDIHAHKIDIVGKVHLTFCVGGQNISDEFMVARGVNLGNVILMGHPACIRNKISLCLPQRGVFIEEGDKIVFIPYAELNMGSPTEENKPGRGGRVVMLKDLVKGNYSARGILKEDIELIPGVPKGVRLEVKGVREGANVMVIEGSERVDQVLAVIALGVVRNGETWVEIVKYGEEYRRLKRGTHMLDVEVFTLPVEVMSGEHADPVWLTESVNTPLNGRREELLKLKLKGSDYPEYNTKILELLGRYPDVVACKGDKLGLTDVIEHKVVLEDGTGPIYIPAYRIPVKVKAEVEKIVNEWEAEGIIRKSSSPFNFPLLAVPKKDGSYRV